MAKVIRVDGTIETLPGTGWRGNVTLKQAQDAVGGYAEVMRRGDLVALVNEDGLPRGLADNPTASATLGTRLVGDVLLLAQEVEFNSEEDCADIADFSADAQIVMPDRSLAPATAEHVSESCWLGRHHLCAGSAVLYGVTAPCLCTCGCAEPWFGLKPPATVNRNFPVWGARAILRGDVMELLPDRQQLRGPKKELASFQELLQRALVPALRKLVKDSALDPGARRQVSAVAEGQWYVAADTRGSHGYVYLGIWRASFEEQVLNNADLAPPITVAEPEPAVITTMRDIIKKHSYRYLNNFTGEPIDDREMKSAETVGRLSALEPNDSHPPLIIRRAGKQPLNPVAVDVQTANAVVQVWDKLSTDKRLAVLNYVANFTDAPPLPLRQRPLTTDTPGLGMGMVDMVWKLIAKAGGR